MRGKWDAATRSAIVVIAGLGFLEPPTHATGYPSGFTETVAFSGLTQPIAVRFAPDGRVFVAEKRGMIRVFDGMADTSASNVIDVQSQVQDYWDRGLLGFALDPQFATNPYVYLFYSLDRNPVTGQGPPYWGDTCPTPPNPTGDGCVITARLSRFAVLPNNTVQGGEQVLLEGGWCHQYPSHSIGSLIFDSTGALLLSAGDGAHFNWVDYGQGGNAGSPSAPPNPCGDPPVGVGGTQTPPTAEGGALRAQDLRTPGDPQSFNGTMLRVDPDTGAALPDNPLYGGPVSGDDRVIAYGLRNPYRATVRPGTDEVWVGDVGGYTWEEFNLISSTRDSIVENFGWPCYEGAGKTAQFDNANLNLCEQLYAQGSAAHNAPFFSYNQSQKIDPDGDACKTGGSAISGLAFYTGGSYPGSYDGALFFADGPRRCIYVIEAAANGQPSLPTRTAFAVESANAVDLAIGPGGDLFYVDIDGGRVFRIRYSSSNTPPHAVAQATPPSGAAPLFVHFQASGSSDPDAGATLSYAWDLDGDGQFDDATIVAPTRNYPQNGTVQVGLRVTDNQQATDVAHLTITVGNTAPSASITSPSSSLHWKVGDAIAFSGHGSDPEQGQLGPAAMHWEIVLHHCHEPDDCHIHSVQGVNGTASGNFVAPDHEWYSYLEFRLTVTDSGGLQHMASVSVDPLSAMHSYASSPPGMMISAAGESAPAPFSHPVIVNSTVTIGTSSPQLREGILHYWTGWSDGGAISHEIVGGQQPTSRTASFAPCGVDDPCDGLDNNCDGTADNGLAPGPLNSLSFSLRDLLEWSVGPDTEQYDLIRGDLGLLRQTGGNFKVATKQCLAHDTPETSFPWPAWPGDPAPGKGFFILLRGESCSGSGTYDSGAASQIGARDLEIAKSAGACPKLYP